MLLDKLDSSEYREINLNFKDTKYPNGLFIVFKELMKHLDNSRYALDLGCYTGIDLDYLLPLCVPLNKRIEMVESFPSLKTDLKNQLIKEIETKYSSPLIKWCWEDASLCSTLTTADFIHISTGISFPIEKYIELVKHRAIWYIKESPWIYEKFANLFLNKGIYVLFYSQSIMILSNDVELKDIIMKEQKNLNSKLTPIGQNLELRNGVFTILPSSYIYFEDHLRNAITEYEYMIAKKASFLYNKP